MAKRAGQLVSILKLWKLKLQAQQYEELESIGLPLVNKLLWPATYFAKGPLSRPNTGDNRFLTNENAFCARCDTTDGKMLPILYLGPLEIPSYFLMISVVCTLGVFLLPAWAKYFGQSEATASEIYLVLLLSGFFGARLFHVLFEKWDHYRVSPIEILFFWNGGFVFLGAVVVSGLGLFWYLRLKGENFLLWADIFSPWLAFGYGMGRIGCFLNGCCYGKVCYLPWGVQFASHKGLIEPWVHRHPTQIYAFLLEMILFLGLLVLTLKSRDKMLTKGYLVGRFFLSWLALHGVFRLINEHYRDDDRGGEFFGLSVSSVISLLLIGVGFWGLVFLKKNKKDLGPS